MQLGSCGRFALPLIASYRYVGSKRQAVDVSQREFLTVLIVDDQQENREVIAAMVQAEWTCRTIDTDDAARALRLADEFRPDVIICDVRMEPMDGLLFLEELRSSPSLQTKAIPVVMLTGMPSPEVAEVVGSFEQTALVAKPVSGRVLSARIRALLQHGANKPRKAD